MIYQFTINTLIHILTAFAAYFTIALLWRFRKSPEVRYLIYLEFIVAFWAITYSFEFATTSLNTKVFLSQLTYLGIVFLPVCYFLFATAFSHKRNLISTKKVAFLLIIPIITIILVFTNEKHHLIWTSATLNEVHNTIIFNYGIGFWIFYAYTETLLFLGLFNLASSIFKFKAYYQKQSGTLIIASFIPIIANLIYVTNINPYPGFNWTPVSFVLTGLIIVLGIFKFNMFNIVPFAKTKLFEILNDGVIVTNAEGFIEDCNAVVYNIFNWQNKSIIHKPFEEIFKSYREITEGLSENLTSIQFEVKHAYNRNYYQIKISPIYNNSKLSGHILLFHDITSIINADEELKNTNRKLLQEIEKREKLIEDLDAFAHTVAHDLRNSLSSIFSASEIMEEIIKVNDKNLLCELSNLINHSANKSIQITHELLLLATTDKTEVELKPLNMAKVFGEAKNQLSDLINNSNAEITEPTEWPEALGYAPWIEEVWSNYLSNAFKYGGTPPKIEVGTEILSNGNIMFFIKDNGKGLTQDEQKKLFNNFVRLNPNKADGYGLGLSIVKKIIEKLNGTVGVESCENGSKFYFILPSNNQTQITLNKLNQNVEYMVN
jgi:signal transduction histidine kinase